MNMNKWTGRPFSEKYHILSEKRKKLPIWGMKMNFIHAFENNQIVLLASPPDSCRNTQIPQYILEHVEVAGAGIIACNQPRRIVATARDVAEEMDVQLGEEIGYVTLLEYSTSSTTILKYLLDGMLLMEAMKDPLLEQYSVIILDEVDERTLATDVLFGYLKDVLKKRSDLKLVIMGATLEPIQKFQEYFNGAHLMELPKMYQDVKLVYKKKAAQNYIKSVISRVLKIHKVGSPGNILVFLTDEDEVQSVSEELRKGTTILRSLDQIDPIHIVPLPSSLPLAIQRNDFAPALSPSTLVGASLGERMVYLGTEIAEKVFSLDNILHVVDCGLVTQRIFNPSNRTESVGLFPISRASAHRRAQRAGRLQGGGTCYRLYPRSDLMPQKNPEIMISNVCSVSLALLRLGINDLVHFDYMDPPAPQTLGRALSDLLYLGAIDEEMNLTKLGMQISEFPLHPEMGKMLVISPQFNCSEEMLSICAMLSVSHLFFHPKEEVQEDEEDYFALLKLYKAFKSNGDIPQQHRTKFSTVEALKTALEAAEKLRRTLFEIMGDLGLKCCRNESNRGDNRENIEKTLHAGSLMQVDNPDEKDTLAHDGCLWNCAEKA